MVGLGDALSSLLATGIAMLRTRLELAMVEFEEQRERTKMMLVLVVIATMFSSFALIALSVVVVVLLWNSYPLAALFGVVLGYVAVAAIAIYALKQTSAPRPFATTLHELERDAEALRKRS